MNLDINAYLSQLPNFAGLILCIMIQQRMMTKLMSLIDELKDVIIKRENCEEPNPKV